MGPRGGSGLVTLGHRRTQSGISVSQAPIHVPRRLPVPERHCHVAEGAVRDSLDAQSVATVDDEELVDPPGLDSEDSDADLFPPPTPRRQRKRAPLPPPVGVDEGEELGDPPALDSDDFLFPPPTPPRSPPRAPRRPPAAAPDASSPPQPRKHDYAFKQFYDAVTGDHDDFKDSAEKLIPPFF